MESVQLHWERTSDSWLLISSRICLMNLFSFADFALYFFTVTNHSHEYNYMLSLTSSSNESSNLRVVLEILPTQ